MYFITVLQQIRLLLLVLYPLVGFFVGIVGAVPYAMVMAFPPAIRFPAFHFPTICLMPFWRIDPDGGCILAEK